MASTTLSWLPSCLLLTILVFQLSHFSTSADVTPPKRHGLPLIKDTVNNQYFTTFILGSINPSTATLIIDLSNRFTWMACDHFGYNSKSSRPVGCDTAKCSAYSLPYEESCVSCTRSSSPGCPSEACGGYAYAPWAKQLSSDYPIIEDVAYFYTRPKDSTKVLQYPMPDFPFVCSSKDPLKGLSPNAQGILSLANVNMALPSVMSKAFKSPQKFALCLPSTSTVLQESLQGALYIGGGPYFYSGDQNPALDVAAELAKTPLLTNPKSTDPVGDLGGKSVEYFINVKSIQVGGRPLKIDPALLTINKNGVGGTKLSTVEPYTVLHSSIYKSLVDTFTLFAKINNIPRVDAVAPFGACYNVAKARTLPSGPDVPAIYFFLQKVGSVQDELWWIPSRSYMVKFFDIKYKDVMCLGFVDGGSDVKTSIVVGAMQMEDTFVEIDVEGKTVGFANSPVKTGARCAQFQSTLPILPDNQEASLLRSDM